MVAHWLNDDSRTFLSRGYLTPGQTAEERIRIICETAERYLNRPGFADEFEGYMLKGWISLSSPVWSNFGNARGLPISCNNVYVSDTTASILLKAAEVGMQTKYGAGTSAYLGALRGSGASISVGGTSFGPVHFAELFEVNTNIISQSNIRRGSCAIYLDVEHKDIEDYLELREEGSTIKHLSLGVCVGDAWMESMIAGDKDKRRIWMRILRKRSETGYPYIFFTDTVNRGAPDVYRDKGMKIHSSNLCSEIALASSEYESFVCNLASLNLLHFDEWKNTGVARALVFFLDAVMTEYIDKTRGVQFMESAHLFAVRQRALGIGTLGWHSYLQSKSIAFESFDAMSLNIEAHRNIRDATLLASQEMAALYGEPELLKGYGRRHVTTMAIAPTTSSSFILGQVSPSIEPLDSNYFVKDLQKGKFTYRNPYLKAILVEKGLDTPEVWNDILIHGGSVQHMTALSDHERKVFKTFGEISQSDIITQAAQRQEFIDQTQSLNLKIHPSASLKDVNQLMIDGWRKGIKTFYYQRSTNPAQEFVRDLLVCSACEA